MSKLSQFFDTFNIWKQKEQEDIIKPLDKYAQFELKYKDLLIGILEWKDGSWFFRYTNEFKSQNRIKPITDFPNINKEYQNKELYPFFLIRIPSLKQPKVQQVIQEQKLEKVDEVALLRLFGQQSIANPFLLTVA